MFVTEAAFLETAGSPLSMGELVLDDLGPREVRIAVSHVGLCHSDLHYISGSRTHETPAVLGHEVAGTIEATGPEVSSITIGDRVVVSLVPSCGQCPNCEAGRPTICQRVAEIRRRPRPAATLPDGTPVARLADVGGFARHVQVAENAAIRLPDDVPGHIGCLLGCCVATGVGSVVHGSKVRPGSSVAVIGCGGVGSAVIQGARIAGASEIIAIDLSDERLRAAKDNGATSTLNAAVEDLSRAINQIVPGGVDYSFEVVGSAATAATAVTILRPGGTANMIGIAPENTTIAIPAEALFFDEKRVIGSYMGSSQMRVDVPEYARLYRHGELRLDELVSRVVPFSAINEGFQVLGQGHATRVVVDMAA